MFSEQQVDVIDVAGWCEVEGNAPYPEGTREKSLYSCPQPAPCEYLIPNHRYLFKKSNNRYAEQFWVEILAYRIGSILGVSVPRAFAAHNSNTGECAALIEWFYGYPDKQPEYFTPGGDILQRVMRNYDRRKGLDHNFETVSRIMNVLTHAGVLREDWKEYWAKTFMFDSLIGNTDRHQDNWGITWKYDDKDIEVVVLSPAFDNGTSMGHEIASTNLNKFEDPGKLSRYVYRGSHHMKWRQRDTEKIPLSESLRLLSTIYPLTTEAVSLSLAKLTHRQIEDTIMSLTQIHMPVPLTEARAKFMISLLKYRHSLLVSAANP